MKPTPYWLIDDRHGWLVVPMDAVLASDATISRFSYASVNGRLAYLEEDADADAFLTAAGIDRASGAQWPVTRVAHAHCRGYPSFAAHVRQ